MLYNELIEQKVRHGQMYQTTLWAFLERYGLGDACEAGLMKAFQRWKRKLKENGDPSGNRGC